MRPRSAVAVSLAIHAAAVIGTTRAGRWAAPVDRPARPVTAAPQTAIATAAPAPIEVEVLDGPDAGEAPVRPAMPGRRSVGGPRAELAGSAGSRPGELGAADGRPEHRIDGHRWFTMRGPDLRLSEQTIEQTIDRIARGGRAPERGARSGRLAPAGGGTAVIHDVVTTITVERDGTAHLHDLPDVDLAWDLPLPTPDRLKQDLELTGQEIARWYADPYARARVGPSQDVPRDAAATPGACDHWGDWCNNELRERYHQVESLQRHVQGSVAHGKLDLTALLMRAVGVGDAYASRKRKALDDTRDERAEMGAQHRAEDLARAAEMMRRNLEALWRATGGPAERRDALFALWDECAEGGGAVGEAGDRARAMVIGWIRARLPAGSPDAFSADEIARRSAQRRSIQPFVPYE